MSNEFKEKLKTTSTHKIRKPFYEYSEIGSDDSIEYMHTSDDLSYLLSKEEREKIFKETVLDVINDKEEER